MERLIERDGIELVRIARATLNELVSTGELPPGAPHRPSLLAERGAAILLRDHDGARGPLLRAPPTGPLYLMVEELVVQAAALGAPLDADALDLMRIGVGVLGDLTAADPDALIVGKHAVLITRGARRGLVLPWNSAGLTSGAALLDAACQRAGLPPLPRAGATPTSKRSASRCRASAIFRSCPIRHRAACAPAARDLFARRASSRRAAWPTPVTARSPARHCIRASPRGRGCPTPAPRRRAGD